tara:strand:+ start:158 stop:388 length:231 start_codon:yes stop_codon:yes gene_type:complete
MSKIFLLLMLMSMPNQPSVKYNAYIYFTEQECLTAKKEYMKNYESKDQAYKNRVRTNAYCVPFDSFPLTTMNNTAA